MQVDVDAACSYLTQEDKDDAARRRKALKEEEEKAKSNGQTAKKQADAGPVLDPGYLAITQPNCGHRWEGAQEDGSEAEGCKGAAGCTWMANGGDGGGGRCIASCSQYWQVRAGQMMKTPRVQSALPHSMLRCCA